MFIMHVCRVGHFAAGTPFKLIIHVCWRILHFAAGTPFCLVIHVCWRMLHFAADRRLAAVSPLCLTIQFCWRILKRVEDSPLHDDHACLSGGALRCGSFIAIDRECLLEDPPPRCGHSTLFDYTRLLRDAPFRCIPQVRCVFPLCLIIQFCRRIIQPVESSTVLDHACLSGGTFAADPSGCLIVRFCWRILHYAAGPPFCLIIQFCSMMHYFAADLKLAAVTPR